jgi:hypothetical protein
MKGGSAMKDQEYPDAPEAAADRMVLGRMVLRIEESGRAVLEAVLPCKAVSADAERQHAAPDENSHEAPMGSTSGKQI